MFNDPIKGFGVICEYAIRRAAIATGYRREGTTFTQAPRLARTLRAPVRGLGTRDLAAASDRILRKHGKSIIDKQFATRRLADIMIDLFVLACVLSRVDSSMREKGVEAGAREIEIARTFAGQARRRIRSTVSEIDANDDEAIKQLADQAFAEEKFSWDTR